MSGEFISIETIQKIATLEKENKELSEIVFKFDAELNKQWKIITETYQLLKSNPSEIKEVLDILKDGLNESKN